MTSLSLYDSADDNELDFLNNSVFNELLPPTPAPIAASHETAAKDEKQFKAAPRPPIAGKMPKPAYDRLNKRLEERRRQQRSALLGITKPDFRRLARRGGVKRISAEIYPDARQALKDFLSRVVGTAIIYTEHSHRRTVSVQDVLYALKQQGRTVYGFSDY